MRSTFVAEPIVRSLLEAPDVMSMQRLPPRWKRLLLLLLLAGLVAPSPGVAGGTLAAGDQRMLGALQPPLLQLTVTSPFGWRLNPVRRTRSLHQGVDYGAPSGTPVHAAQTGIVEAVGMDDRSGIFVRLRHSAAVTTEYAHLHKVMPGLRAGSMVRCGDVLGFVGESGFATGPHLHYEVLINGTPIDPQRVNSIVEVVSLK